MSLLVLKSLKINFRRRNLLPSNFLLELKSWTGTALCVSLRNPPTSYIWVMLAQKGEGDALCAWLPHISLDNAPLTEKWGRLAIIVASPHVQHKSKSTKMKPLESKSANWWSFERPCNYFGKNHKRRFISWSLKQKAWMTANFSISFGKLVTLSGYLKVHPFSFKLTNFIKNATFSTILLRCLLCFLFLFLFPFFLSVSRFCLFMFLFFQ